eukprot:m51a1_g12382 putative non-processive endoglucanase (409) ;mRNA; f:629972-631741
MGCHHLLLLLSAIAVLSHAECTDVPPDGRFTCAQQASWGKCNEPWMKSPTCDMSCGRCSAPTPIPDPDPAPVSCNGGIPTELNGNVWALGVNYAQHSWSNGWMGDFLDYDWESKFDAIKRELGDMKAKGVRVVRWWIFARSDILPYECWNGPIFTGLPDKYVDHLEQAVDFAKSIGLLVYPTLMSFDWGKGQHREIFTDAAARRAWIDNAVTPIVSRLRDNAGVFAWDLCNEPEWIVDDADGGEPCGDCARFRLADAKALFNGVIAVLRAKGARQPVSLGSASLKFLTQKPLWNDMDLDFWDFHWYSWATSWFNPLLLNASDAVSPSKPIVLGEVMPDPSQDSVLASPANAWCRGRPCTDHGRIAARLSELGYSGYLPWAWTDQNFLVVPHIRNHFLDFNAACPPSRP